MEKHSTITLNKEQNQYTQYPTEAYYVRGGSSAVIMMLRCNHFNHALNCFQTGQKRCSCNQLIVSEALELQASVVCVCVYVDFRTGTGTHF